MKSSITTRSVVPPALTSVLVAFKAASLLVIRTRATIGESNTAPTKLNPWAPSRAGAGTLAISTPFASKYSTRADGHEQLLGRERLELVRQSGVDRRERRDVHPEARAGAREQGTPLRGD